MNFLHLIATVDPRHGGPIEGVRQLAVAGRAAGDRTTVACFDAPGAPFLAGQPFETVALGPARSSYGWSPHVRPWLESNAAEHDVVVVHGLWQFVGLGARLAARRTGVPYLVFPHGMLDPWFRSAYPLKHAKKLAYWLAVERRVLREAAAVLYTCEEERRLAQSTFPGYACRELVVGYGTARPPGDPERARRAFLERHPALARGRLVLFMSRIHEKKGCDLLVRGFAAHAAADPSLRLAIAGPGDPALIAKLRALIAELGIEDRVVWTGMLEGELKVGALHAADVLALPSHQENFGIVVAEALACGTPVAISRRVNIWREIESAAAGWVDEDTVAGVTAMLGRWLSASPADLARARVAATRCFAERFEMSGVALRLRSFAAELADRSRAAGRNAQSASSAS